MAHETFPYSRGSFLLTTFLLLILTSFVMALFIMMGPDIIVLATVALICVAIVFFFGLSPLLTKHGINNEELVLNQGLFFKAKIPLHSIISAERLSSGPRRTGAYLSMGKNTIYVTTRKSDLIMLKLREPQRFPVTFGRRADTVVFDCLDTSTMISRLNGKVTPASQDRSF